ncbi:MAG: CHAD domain-containing protein [Dehalococcoidia bacterium]
MTLPTSAIEVEWQFDAPDLEAVRRWLESQPAHSTLAFVARPERVQHDEYLDTHDWRVHRARFTLRVRSLPDAAEATLKAFGDSADGVRRRLEINQPLPSGVTDPLAAEGPVSERLRLLLGSRDLRSLVVVDTHRRPYLIQRDGVTLATLTLDEATVPGSEAPPIRRVEVEEAFPGAMSEVDRFLHALRAATGLTLASRSKFESGLAAVGLTPDAGLDFGTTEVADAADAPAAPFAYAAIRRNWAALLRREPGTRLGEDIEELHQMRVATRRLRAAMSAFAPVLPEELHSLRDELRWLAAALGAVRDLDVQLEALEHVRREAGWDEGNAIGPLIDLVEESRREARRLLLATLDSPAYDSLVQRLSDALRAGPPPATPAEGVPASAREFAAALLRRRYRSFRRDAERLTRRSEAAEFHAVRIRAKRLRYSVDFTESLFGRPALRLERELRRTQDLLGEHQDADVARAWLHDVARDRGGQLPPDTLFLMGQLSERHAARMVELRRDWPGHLERLEDRWTRLRRTFDAGATAAPPRPAPEGVRPRLAAPAPRRPRRVLRLPGFPRRPLPTTSDDE